MSAYSENFKLIEWLSLPESTPARPLRPHKTGPYLVPDIAPFVSPLDFTVVSSRSTLREHERKHGVRQVGELKTPQDFDNSPKRAEAFRERSFDQAFRVAIEKTGI